MPRRRVELEAWCRRCNLARGKERKQWPADAERLGWDKERLTQEWDVAQRTAERRTRLLRGSR